MSVALRGRYGWLVAPALACSMMIGCGDDDEDPQPSPLDGGNDGAVVNLDGGIDATAPAPDASKPLNARVLRAEISTAGDDALYGVTFDGAGNIFAVGKTSPALGAASDSSFAVAKYTAAGTLDPTFGQGGYVTINVTEGGVGQEQARAVLVQASTGKIVVLGQAETKTYPADAGVGVLANDTDVILVRLNPNGSVDTSFGGNNTGIARFDLGTGYVRPASTLPDGGTQSASMQAADAPYSLSETTGGRLVVHTATAGLEVDGGSRQDTDFALLRTSADGVLDTDFGGTGVVRTDFDRTNASVRSATVLSNGSIVGSGYSTNTVLNGTSSQNPVIYKVNADGTPDTSFATGDTVKAPGVWHDFARVDQNRAEAYGAAPQGDKFVTLGYGPSPDDSTFGSDWVWLRFNADGSQDKSFGVDGVTFQDVGKFADNGRALLTLPDNRVLGVGTGRPTPATLPEKDKENTVPTDGVISVLSPNGAPDTAFGPGGLQRVDFFGGVSDSLYSVVLSSDKSQVAAVGEGANASSMDDKDGIVVLFSAP
jgi:uncharacterized delta-60 repeat protein